MELTVVPKFSLECMLASPNVQQKMFGEEPTERQLEITKFEGWDKLVVLITTIPRSASDIAAEEGRQAL